MLVMHMFFLCSQVFNATFEFWGDGESVCVCVCFRVDQTLDSVNTCVYGGLSDRCQVSQVLEEVRSLVDSLISCLSGETNHHVSTATWHFVRCMCVCVCVGLQESLCVYLTVSVCMLGMWKRFWSWQDYRVHTVCVAARAHCFCVCVCVLDWC